MQERTRRARRLLVFTTSALGLTLGLTLALASGVGAGGGAPRDVSRLMLDEPITIAKRPQTSGAVNAVVRLKDAPLAVVMGPNWKQNGGALTKAQQRAYVAGLEREQAVLLGKLEALGGEKLGTVSMALNAVIVSIDSAKLDEVAKLGNVASVREIGDYRLDLSETVPHIGAAAVQAAGVDGTGVNVAVLDSGIDYTHASMGGAGTAAAYTDAYGTTTADARNKVINDNPASTADNFPTAKVTQGFDFVGEAWPSDGPDADTLVELEPDPDPIDCGPAAIPLPCAGSHGTHVSDIIAGIGTSEGVGTAPGAKLYAVKVCSSTSTACSGVGLLLGMDFALDPNGDNDMSDAADVINMSLGSNYGQREDDLSFASTNAVNAGVSVVAAAGNAADRPYIVSSPSTAPEAISVAQTQVPSAKLYLIDPSAAGFPSVGGSWQPWSATPSLKTGDLFYDTTSLATKRGCSSATGTPSNPTANPWTGTPLAGKIVLVERGVCNISWKVYNVAQAGGIAAVIANNALQSPGDLPPDFSFGGPGLPPLAISAYTITLRDANRLKGLPETTPVNANPAASNAFGAPATIDPSTAVSLVNNMVASSARGPSYSFNSIKPDIGAPGASNSAVAGSGTANSAFGGTSGATPMVAGSVALLVDKYNGARTPSEMKSLLMNTAETAIGLNPVGLPGVMAPITRIGGGEVRVNQAAASNTAAWDDDEDTGSLSFGFHTVSRDRSVTREVRVRNYSGSAKTYSISHEFRYADDAASGAVSLSHRSSIRVPANSSRTFEVELDINGENLPQWALDGGFNGGNGSLLQTVEFDGYVNLVGGGDSVHLAWQVLPRRSADVESEQSSVKVGQEIKLDNDSKIQDGDVEVFSLLGTSPRIPRSALPNAGDNFAIIDIKEVGGRMLDLNGAAAGGEIVEFGISTFGTRSHPNYPAEFDIFLNTDADPADEFVIFNLENGGFGVTGQNLVAIQNLQSPCPFAPTLVSCPAQAFFFTDADLDTGNIILTVPIQSTGLAITPGTQVTADVLAADNYFTGAFTDAVEDLTFTPNTPKYAVDAGQFQAVTVPADDKLKLTVSAVPGGDTASPSQTGFLFLERLARQPEESDRVIVRVPDNDENHH